MTNTNPYLTLIARRDDEDFARPVVVPAHTVQPYETGYDFSRSLLPTLPTDADDWDHAERRAFAAMGY